MVRGERANRWRELRTRLAGWAWAGAWLWLLALVQATWSGLGGVVPERVLWMARCATGTGLVVGCLVGSSGRRAAQRSARRSHVGLLRWMLWPQAACVAVALLALARAGREDAVGVVVAAFLAYWAGLDVGFAAWPLMHGRHYSPRGAIQPDPQLDPREECPDEELRPRLPI